jgi:hypothetical protein
VRHSDLAEYLESRLFLEDPAPQLGLAAKSEVSSEAQLLTPGAPDQPPRSAQTERDQLNSAIVQMVMDVFPGARWTTREAYKRAAALRDRKGRKTRGRS